jgi:5-methylcytosine-specific restriction endonuclease McrA
VSPNREGSNRQQTLPKDWPAIVMRRDHHRCRHVREDTGRKCGRSANQVDHIVPYTDGGTDDDRNLQALCEYHHRQKSGREGGVASGRARRARRDAAKPIHPGLIDAPTDALSHRRDLEQRAPF